MTPSELYADVRLRMSDLVRDLPDAETRTPVPGCPGWTVHDVVAHATGIVVDVLGGHLDGVASDPWTNRQVEERRDTPLPDILDEWAKAGVEFEPTLDQAPKGMWRTLLIDLTTHEQDIRGALGTPGGRDSEPYEIARKGYAVALAKRLDEYHVPGLQLRAPGWEFDAGTDPQATLTAPDAHEIFRTLAGRRGIKQILGYDWAGDPAVYLPHLNHFGDVPEEDVVES